jgi:hypothetical protein
VYKVVFVVDRKDLDYQTMTEFNAFKKDSVDVTDNTQSLIRQLTDNTKLELTTIQKIDNAVSECFAGKIEPLRHKKIVFIFDECHCSQFGETHERITKFFEKSQLIGFTRIPTIRVFFCLKKTALAGGGLLKFFFLLKTSVFLMLNGNPTKLKLAQNCYYQQFMLF